ncbi:UDP-N-acetylmuramoyl-L-alanyl-D-glutamate--2,6-diaminopimelate ligase [Desulfosediminicola flagellatus]|uniref:UDP-N-acetylmuramoyl-L-alanyl-D-glutamate--2, 6-diaminopimelate ligase n=1 Tax=Desulfosediminicola flagellatus TaxID=2569541 RepID=UPI0010AD2E38|nr:UDP-N-acetylmuramoyl-L-alanyl-D-glutamate--2,6-diaminopimelate ligase [Desulfosediminicola flagellatus]
MTTADTNKNKHQPPGMGESLATLLEGVDYTHVTRGGDGNVDVKISSVTNDSRSTLAGAVFFAVSGYAADGHVYIEDAMRLGCAAIVVNRNSQWVGIPGWQGCVVEVDDSRVAYAVAAENYFGRPADSLKLVAITGTNGKTTITYLLEDVFEGLGYRAGVIGTVNYRYNNGVEKIIHPSPFTTPEPMQLQKLLFEMAESGVEYVVMEVSSHALDQRRIGNIRFDVAAFTNLSRDHLDYHHTMEEYFQTKAILFENHLKPDAKAVISTPQHQDDGDWSAMMREACTSNSVATLSCGLQVDADIRIDGYASTLTETVLNMSIAGQSFSLTTPLVGHYNVDNLVTALTLTQALGLDVKDAIVPLASSKGAPGRLERVEIDDLTNFQRPVVFVDYAHTPDALKQVLKTVSALPHRDLFCVFGCGGDRDSGKRAVMGAIAGEYADVAIITDDNPRTEQPEGILKQIVSGIDNSGLANKSDNWLAERGTGEQGYVVIGNRKDAIERAVKAAGPDDIVLIAGKGHEKYQLGINGKRFFDDVLEAQTSLMCWNLESLALATSGKIRRQSEPSAKLGNISTDSRTISTGDIFVALVGEKFDAHDFLVQVEKKGAGCLIIQSGTEDKNIPERVALIEVEDTLQALADLARFRRRLIKGVSDQVVVGITGSCGKTTVKEMTASIFRRVWPEGPDNPEKCVLFTQGNLNNLIGLPLSLFPLTPRHRAAVLEMGMNCPGEIRIMARAAEPAICCITNVHGVHLEGLHTIEGVASAKEELFAEAGPASVLVINLDDENIRKMAPKYSQAKVRFSAQLDERPEEADVYVSDIQAGNADGISFKLHISDQVADVQLHTVGLHNVANSVAAAAIATAAGATISEITAGLADFRPADRRMVQLKTDRGLGVLNDTYNANPASMAAGLNTLVQMGTGKSAALLGDMLELGESSVESHLQIGRLAAELGVSYLGAVGKFKKEILDGALSGGMSPEYVRTFESKDNAAEWIEKLEEEGRIGSGDWLLIKASRGLQMETIVARLTGKT